MLVSYISLFVIVLTILFLFLDLSFVIYISYLYYKLKIKNNYIEGLIFALLILYIIKFLSVFSFIPIIVYLAKQDYEILESVDKTSYFSFITLRKENPLAFALIASSYLIYILAFGGISIITSELINQANRANLTFIAKQITYIKLIDSTFFALYLIFGLITFYIFIAETIIRKNLKSK